MEAIIQQSRIYPFPENVSGTGAYLHFAKKLYEIK
jgi:hypothetical protein